MTVVDYDRIKRLQLPEDGGPFSFMAKVYIVLIALCIVFLVKKYRDKQVASSKSESLSMIIYPSERDGL